MIIGAGRDNSEGERRVALVPDSVAAAKKLGLEVLVETGAGEAAFFRDADYQAAGARVAERGEVLKNAEILAKVQRPSLDEAESIREGAVLVSFLQPAANLELLRKLAQRRISAFSMELIPRISRAQSMD